MRLPSICLLLLLAQGCASGGQALPETGSVAQNAESRFESARAGLQAGKVTEAAALYSEAAKQGHAAAQFSLGVLYALGAGVSYDVDEALIWYGKAAEQATGEAQYVLAQRLEQGVAGRTDGGRPKSWLDRLSRLGDPTNPLRLGSDYTFGRDGLEADPEQAAVWYRRAAKQAHVMAWYRLGQMHAGGLGIEGNHLRAHMWFTLCAELQLGDSVVWKRKLEELMTDEQLAQSAELVRQWKETTPAPDPIPPTPLSRPVHGQR